MLRQAIPRAFVLLLLFSLASVHASSLTQAELGVVRIDTEVRGNRAQLGSGFAVSPTHVITNYHVVEPILTSRSSPGRTAMPLLVAGTSPANGRMSATVLSYSKEVDLALLQVDGGELLPLTLYLPEPSREQSLLSLGFPGNLQDATGGELRNTPFISRGIIGYLEKRNVGTSSEHLSILHQAPTGPGNSGGPVLDECFRVIGVTVRGFPAPRGGATLYDAIHVVAARDLAERQGVRPLTSVSPCVKDKQKTSPWAIATSHWMLAMLLSGTALLVAMRRPRQTIVHVAEQASRKITEGVSKMMLNNFGNRAERNALMVLSGFMPDTGKAIRIAVSLPDVAECAQEALREFVVGRSNVVAHFALDDASLSRRHVRFLMSDGQQVLVEDLNSACGTVLNGQTLTPFTPVPAKPGDTLTLGKLELRIHASGLSAGRTR